jgi:hypothetical protein
MSTATASRAATPPERGPTYRANEGRRTREVPAAFPFQLGARRKAPVCRPYIMMIMPSLLPPPMRGLTTLLKGEPKR